MVVTDYCCSSQFITSFVPISLSLSISVYLVPTPTQVHHHQECRLHFRTDGLVLNSSKSGTLQTVRGGFNECCSKSGTLQTMRVGSTTVVRRVDWWRMRKRSIPPLRIMFTLILDVSCA